MVTVVIPLYNKVRHIQRALQSVLGQTYKDFEIVVIDDGSTDGGAEIVSAFSNSRIRLIQQENAGASAARNRGIREATGELVAFLDADDEWLPCFLETVIGLRTRHPEAGMYATAYRYSKGDATWRPTFTDCSVSPQGGLLDDYFRVALGTTPVCSSAVMIPKCVLAEVGYFPVGVGRGEDLQTWVAIALRHFVAWSPVDGAVYHLDAENRACMRSLTTADIAAASVIEEFLQSGRELVSSRRMVEEYLVSRRLEMALDCHLRGKRTWAVSLLNKTQHTTMFKRRRRFLQCVVWIPPRVIKYAMTLKGLLRHGLRGT